MSDGTREALEQEHQDRPYAAAASYAWGRSLAQLFRGMVEHGMERAEALAVMQELAPAQVYAAAERSAHEEES